MRSIGLVLLFLLSIVGANWAVTNIEPVSVGFGQYAPAGVYLVAITLVLRDLVQRFSGLWGILTAFAGGVLLSYALADPAVVTASVIAFSISFLVDTAVFTVARRAWPDRFWLAVLVSGLVSLVPDSIVFCYLAGFPEFIPGQLLGKFYGTVLYAALVGFTLRRADLEADVRK